ncbi:hypothetical protein [Phyllobacterium leguminum]|uniref:Uncharacterized protein n=1 Tax=Phyllobacterium leguminum TaxID=314237 RepID=A0A318T5G7_9HYPH|nr:hypothetical protein [Phyllobacterium leguminum]PYE87512.1 hypothetical protein C7477_11213 [Phyllobacterium leguminum]
MPGTWYPKHIGFLGGAAPAVTGLRNVQFSAPDASVTVSADFGERGFEDAAGLFQMLREFILEKFGREDADKALPAFRIEWLSEIEIEKPSLRPAFSEPPVPRKKEPLPVTKPNTPPDPAFAARDAALTEREERIRKREQEAAHADNASFAESLVADGKLLPVSKDKVVLILGALPAETSVSFAAGEAAVPVAQALRDILKAQPKIVSFGAFDMPEMTGAGGRAASFAADGKPVDPSDMELHAKAVAYQKVHPGMAYLDAVAAVS